MTDRKCQKPNEPQLQIATRFGALKLVTTIYSFLQKDMQKNCQKSAFEKNSGENFN
jgi:hypothetical protein